MRGRYIVQTLFVAGLVFSIGLVSQAQQYNLTTIKAGYPGSGPLYYNAPKINNSGQVVEIAPGGGSGYLFSGGVTTPLPSGFEPLDINNKGAIAMRSVATNDNVISLPPYTTWTSMGSLPPCGIQGDSVATGLNDSGAAVGIIDAPTSCPQPFYSFNGQMAAMGGAPPYAEWMAINNSNQIVGTELFPGNATSYATERAVQLVNGTLTDIDPANAYAYGSEAVAINDNGQFIVNSNQKLCTRVIGIPPFQRIITYVCSGTIWNPWLYTGNVPTNLGGLGTAGGTAFGINLWGDVVGMSQITSGDVHGFLYSMGSMTDLNSHGILNVSGWTIVMAADINDFGQIVAYATDSNGNQNLVLLTPAPVTQPAIASLTLNPTSVAGPFGVPLKSVGTVTLASAAPAGGTIVSIGSNSTVAKVPSMIRVNAGATTASFLITVNPPLRGTVTATITAKRGSNSTTATLTVSGS